MDKNDILNATLSLDRFEERMRYARENDSFDTAIYHLKYAEIEIKFLEEIIAKMKQEQHDLLNDVYNKFKNMGLVKTIKFSKYGEEDKQVAPSNSGEEIPFL